MYARASKRSTLASNDSAIVIDGFLRSGNTFSVAAFMIANGRDAKVARHLHGGAHVLRAARLGLPTVVLIRQPADAVASYLIRRPSLTLADALLEYIDFYRTAWLARGKFVVAPFAQVIADFGVVIDAVNQHFGTRFARFVPTDANKAAAFDLVEELNRQECGGQVVETHVGRPSVEREDRQQEIRDLLRRPKTSQLLTRADVLFAQYVPDPMLRLPTKPDRPQAKGITVETTVTTPVVDTDNAVRFTSPRLAVRARIAPLNLASGCEPKADGPRKDT